MSAGEQTPQLLEPVATPDLDGAQPMATLPQLPEGVHAPDFVPDHLLESGVEPAQEQAAVKPMSADEMYAARDSRDEAAAFGRIYEDQHSDDPAVRAAGTYLAERMETATPGRFEAFTHYAKARDAREKAKAERASTAPDDGSRGPDTTTVGHGSDESGPTYFGGYTGYRPTQPHGPVVNNPDSLRMMQAAAASYTSAGHETSGGDGGQEDDGLITAASMPGYVPPQGEQASQGTTDHEQPQASPSPDMNVRHGDTEPATSAAGHEGVDVTSLEAYRDRTRAWAKAYNVEMTEDEINAEANRQRERDFRPGILTRMRNHAYRIRGGKNDPRIVARQDNPVWYAQHARNTGAEVRTEDSTPTPVATTPEAATKPEDDVRTATREFTPAEVAELEALFTAEPSEPEYLSVEERKWRMQADYKAKREQARQQERTEKWEQRREAVRRRLANVALSTYFILPEPIQAAVANAAARRSAARG